MAASLEAYTEGVVFDARGVAYVSVLDKETVFAIEQARAPESWYRVVKPNGHKVLPDGTHLVAATGGVHHVGPDGRLIEVLAPELATPNDLALDGDGGVYITVPAEADPDGKRRRSAVYYLDATRTVRKVADDFCYPNGIVVRPDGRSLLVNDSCNRQIYEFTIDSPGVLSGRRILAEVSDPRSVPDGMTLDGAGQIYMADYGRGVVAVFGHTGVAIREYATGLKHASNVAFGGKALKDLYVTGSAADAQEHGQLVVLPLGIKGRSPLTLPASGRGR